MSTTTRKRYRVSIVAWSNYVRWIEAPSRDEVMQIAESDFGDNGDENFTAKDGGIESVDVLDEEEIGGAT